MDNPLLDSERTTTVARLDGKPLVRGADGLVHGEPLNFTDEERETLPPLGLCDPDAPVIYGTSGIVWFVAPFTVRRLFHEQRYTFATMDEAREFAVAANAAPSAPDEPWGMEDARGADVPQDAWLRQ